MFERLLLAIILAAACTGCTPPLSHAGWDDPWFEPAPPYAREGPTESSDALGDVWEIEEVSGWRGVWLRREDRSRLFDGYWMHPGGERIRAPLEIRIFGQSVNVIRRHPDGGSCRYLGRIDASGLDVAGQYSCTWATAPMDWHGRIQRFTNAAPARQRFR